VKATKELKIGQQKERAGVETARIKAVPQSISKAEAAAKIRAAKEKAAAAELTRAKKTVAVKKRTAADQ
jgi:hypothetical protein